ncbi:MAG: hypothetical protein ACT4PU_02230 [Planctomycetota bacterium]
MSPRRGFLRRAALTALLGLSVLLPVGCMSPFSDHASDVHQAWGRKATDAHRKWDRYVLGLDWDDPYHDWHDESFASGPMHGHH